MLSESAFVIQGYGVPLNPYHSSAQMVLHTILMGPVVIPRVLAISLIFASFEGWYALIQAVTGGLLYSILSRSVYLKVKDSVSITDGTVIVVMTVLAIFLPCGMGNPECNLLVYFSSLATFVLSLFLGILCLIAYLDNDLLTASIVQDVEFYHRFCGILIGLMVFGIFITAFQVWLVRRNHQTFIFQCAYGNTDVVELMLVANEAETNFNEVNANQWNSTKLRSPRNHSTNFATWEISWF